MTAMGELGALNHRTNRLSLQPPLPDRPNEIMARFDALLRTSDGRLFTPGWRALVFKLLSKDGWEFQPAGSSSSRKQDVGSTLERNVWANAVLLKRQIESRASSRKEAAELLQAWFVVNGRRSDAGRLLTRLTSEFHSSKKGCPSWIFEWLKDRQRWACPRADTGLGDRERRLLTP